MTASVEKKAVSENNEPVAEEKPQEEKKDTNSLTVEDIREHCKLIERSVVTKEARFAARVLRGLTVTRRKLNGQVLRRIINGFYTHSQTERDFLLKCLPEEESMETDEVAIVGPVRLRGAKSALTPLLVEVDCYLHLLVLIYLKDLKNCQNNAAKCAENLVGKIHTQNKRCLDQIAGRCYYYYSLCYEIIGQQAKIRDFLHARLRTATLSNDFESQAVIINSLLRNYLHYNLYDQADRLVLKTSFPEKHASNGESAKFLYYMGRIKAIQLDYTDASKHLTQALRKAPTTNVGFKETVQTLNVTVQLLLGTTPERKLLFDPQFKRILEPYFELTTAIRAGDVGLFQRVLDKFTDTFQKHKTYTLILRLHHNVIKTAIRRISLAYSCISLVDIAKKLKLDSPMDAEYIIAKAIRDGVIEAVLDHGRGVMQSKDNIDVYCTREPQLAFNQRIQFCLDLHNHSVKAMRFPPKSYNQDLESAEDRREREAQEMETAKELAEEDDDLI